MTTHHDPKPRGFRLDRFVEALFAFLPWVIFVLGYATRDPYLFATGGLLVLLDTIREAGR